MKLLKFNIILIVLIITLGMILRLYRLDSVPPGLTWDEAALGYNAFSILKTGKDEYGNFLPLTLKSFGDYKPALYAYIDIPFVLILGLNEWAVRLPSVIAGIGFIILCYLIIKKVFKDESLSLAAAFFAAISPLSIQFSRAAWESNIAVSLNLLGLYLFLKALEKPKYYIFSAIIFSISLICYQGSKVFVPLLVFGLAILFWKEFKRSKFLVTGALIMAISVVLVYFSTFFLGNSDRLAAQNFFAYPRTQQEINLIAKEDGVSPQSPEFQILHGEWFAYTRGLVERYLTYFSPNILFVKGDYSHRHSVPGLGVLNYYALFFIPFGIYLLWRKRERNRWVIIYWLFIASIPAVLSRDLISMVRALNLMFPFAILEAFGFIFLVQKSASLLHISRKITAGFFLLLVTANFIYYLDFYFIHMPKEYSLDWMYGYKEIINQLPDTSKYNKVIFTDKYGQPYIYYLFYKQYPPEKYQPQANLEQTSVDVGTVRKIDNFEFRPIDWTVDRGLENTLLIGTSFEIPRQDVETEKKSKRLYRAVALNNMTALKIIENGYNEK